MDNYLLISVFPYRFRMESKESYLFCVRLFDGLYFRILILDDVVAHISIHIGHIISKPLSVLATYIFILSSYFVCLNEFRIILRISILTHLFLSGTV